MRNTNLEMEKIENPRVHADDGGLHNWYGTPANVGFKGALIATAVLLGALVLAIVLL